MPVTRLKPLYDRNGKIKGYVDKYTGEDFGFPVVCGRKRNPYIKGWVMNSQEAMVALAKDKDIKGETHRVLGRRRKSTTKTRNIRKKSRIS